MFTVTVVFVSVVTFVSIVVCLGVLHKRSVNNNQIYHFTCKFFIKECRGVILGSTVTPFGIYLDFCYLCGRNACNLHDFCLVC